MKRVFDVLISFFVLVVFIPIGLIISLLIVLTSTGGVFYQQERIGLNGIPFKIFKFRTMRIDSDKKGKLTVGMRDSRITSIGYFLRKYKLDEFPQFTHDFKVMSNCWIFQIFFIQQQFSGHNFSNIRLMRIIGLSK